MALSEDNIMVNGLWIGSELSSMELLTINSFLAHGHRFRLWLYDEMGHDLPPGVEVMDANAIIPSERVFHYRNTDQFGHGKGSVSGFSDIFRYKLLYDHGGWWVDMDVTCLQPLQAESPYYFRSHHSLMLVGNVLKCPKGSEVMLRSYDEANGRIDENNTDWHGPINILVGNVKELGLQHHIIDGHSMQDHWNQVKKHVFTHRKPDKNWWFIHWMNEEWRLRQMDKEDFMIASTYGQLLLQYGLAKDDSGPLHRIMNTGRFALGRYVDSAKEVFRK